MQLLVVILARVLAYRRKTSRALLEATLVALSPTIPPGPPATLGAMVRGQSDAGTTPRLGTSISMDRRRGSIRIG